MTSYDKILRWIMPISEKLENQKHIQSIKEGMISIIPIIIVGSFGLIPIGLGNLLGSGMIYDFIQKITPFLMYPITFTTGVLSLYSVFFIAYYLAGKYKITKETTAINAILVQLILVGTVLDGSLNIKYLGAEGIFLSIFSAILTVEVTRKIYEKNLFIKMPESVPPMVLKSFKSLVPIIVTIYISVILVFFSNSFFGAGITPTLMDFLAPAINSMDTLTAIIIIVFLTQFLWFFGIHGAAVTSSIWVPFAIMYGSENIANNVAGLPVTHFFTFGFYYCMLQVTGSGLTLGLNLLMLRSKSKNFKVLGKTALLPSLFGINEPLIFGAPIILNPFMIVPFIFGPVLIAIITYLCMSSGIVGMPIAEPPSFLPPGVGAFLMTYDFKAVILVFVNLSLMTGIYYPFFKAMEKKELQKELHYENNDEIEEELQLKEA